MSSDESTATHISAASSQTTKNWRSKPNKPEQFEIDLIGTFVLSLYHRSLISHDCGWEIKKADTRKEYKNFIIKAEQSNKIKKLPETADIGTLLQRCGFLINTKRGSEFYKIKYMELFRFRNDKIKEMDDLRKNIDNLKKINTEIIPENNSPNLCENAAKLITEENFEIDEDVPKQPLEYQGTLLQQRVSNHRPTNTSCCICQEDFSTMEKFEEHIQKHGEETDFEHLSSMKKIDEPIFKLSYGLCKNSHYFYFEIETFTSDLTVEKIIIVQSRSYYYVHNMKVPYKIPQNGQDCFFVDSHLFTIHVEQPIIIISHLESSKETRIIEQHHFMRSEEFPKIHFAVNPYRLPNKKIFTPKFELVDYFPPKEIQDSLNDDFYYEKLMNNSNEFREYVQSGKKLQPQTIGESLKILLQIEDVDTMRQYLCLTQQNVTLRKFGNEYSFRLKPKQRVFIENILSPYDEVVLTRKNIINNPDAIKQLMMQNKNDMIKPIVGQIIDINTGRVCFKSYKPIDITVKYTIVCRPSRLNIRYQYRSLELLPENMGYLRKFLFPTKIIPRPLSTISLSLYNDKVALIPEQLQAVRNIAEGPRNDATYIIFGPPGTGKTTTLVESILQLLKKSNTKILVTASSNSACDEVALRLSKYLQDLDLKRCLVRIYSRSAEVRIDNIDDELLEHSNMYSGQFYPDIGVLHEYRVVVCTLSVVAKLSTGKFGRHANSERSVYTHLFIDEVAASMEADALLAITTILSDNSCLIISGDHKQLGPILKSKRAQELGLDVSLMERLLDRDCYRVDIDTGDYDRTIQTRLRRNYRSHPAIVNLYSGLYYNHSVEPYANIENVSLGGEWYKTKNKNYPIIFHAIYEPSVTDKQSNSLYNIGELRVVMDYVKDLMYFGINGKPVNENDIGIISPYKKQYRRIQEELNLRKWFNIETGSVETFQGKEKEIIIVSFVRSCTSNLGFLENPRRLNVTLSRPKSILILIGNPTTLSLNSEFEFIIKECQRHNTFVGLRKQNNSQEKFNNLNKTLEELRISSETLTEDSNNRESNWRNRVGRKPDNNIDQSLSSTKTKMNGEEEDKIDTALKENKEKNCNRGGGYRRRFKAKKKSNSKNKNSEEGGVDSDKDDDGNSDDDGGNNDNQISYVAANSIKTTTNNEENSKNRSQSNSRVSKQNDGKISKRNNNKGKQNSSMKNKRNAAGKNIDVLFDELPKVPQTVMNDNNPILFSQQQKSNIQMGQQYNYNMQQRPAPPQQQHQYQQLQYQQLQYQQQQQLFQHFNNFNGFQSFRYPVPQPPPQQPPRPPPPQQPPRPPPPQQQFNHTFKSNRNHSLRIISPLLPKSNDDTNSNKNLEKQNIFSEKPTTTNIPSSTSTVNISPKKSNENASKANSVKKLGESHPKKFSLLSSHKGTESLLAANETPLPTNISFSILNSNQQFHSINSQNARSSGSNSNNLQIGNNSNISMSTNSTKTKSQLATANIPPTSIGGQYQSNNLKNARPATSFASATSKESNTIASRENEHNRVNNLNNSMSFTKVNSTGTTANLTSLSSGGQYHSMRAQDADNYYNSNTTERFNSSTPTRLIRNINIDEKKSKNQDKKCIIS